MNKLIYLIFTLVAIQLNTINVLPCTMFTKTENGRTLVGNNEDWINPFSKVWFKPAKENKYGAIYFGFADQRPFGGINEKGLVVDLFSVPYKNTTSKSNKKISIELVEKILQEAATVDQGLKLLKKYDLREMLNNLQVMLVDRKGNSAIYEGEITLPKKNNYQLITNFRLSEYQGATIFACKRYNTANKMLKNSSLSIDNFAKILDAVKNTEGFTIYSYIIDLDKNQIYLYHYNDFTKPYIINVKEELDKGYHVINIPSLFKNKNYDKFLTKYLSNKPNQITTNTTNYEKYTGVYYLNERVYYPIITKNNKLYYNKYTELEMLPLEENKFFFKELGHTFTFEKNILGSYSKVLISHPVFGSYYASKENNYIYYISGSFILLFIGLFSIIKYKKVKN